LTRHRIRSLDVREPELVDRDSELVDVESVAPLAGYNVRLAFSDGIERTVDLEPYLRGPIFERVRDPEYFRRVRVDKDTGTIAWPNGADIDPLILRYDLVPAWHEEEFAAPVGPYARPEFFTSKRRNARLFGRLNLPFGFIFLVVAVTPVLVGILAERASVLIVVAASVAQLGLLMLLVWSSYLELRLQRQSQMAALELVDHLPRVSFVEVDSDGQIRIAAGVRTGHPISGPRAALAPGKESAQDAESPD
jgi:hypothetical protein